MPDKDKKTYICFYCCRPYGRAIKALLCNTNICILLTMTCSSTEHRRRIVAFIMQQWSRESATILHYTYCCNTSLVGTRTFFSCLKGHTSRYIIMTFRKLLHFSSSEEERSSFRNAVIIQCGVCVFRRWKKSLYLVATYCKLPHCQEIPWFSYSYSNLYQIRIQCF